MKTAPKNIDELLARCRRIEGLSFAQLAREMDVVIPPSQLTRKGWIGMVVEMALGADANSKPKPDFNLLQIELKTIPLNHHGKPRESTFVSSIALRTLGKETWQTSSVYQKLQRVLWLPVEGEPGIPYASRRIGQATLWSPSEAQWQQLEQDWHELTELILLGQLEVIDASLGTYLQIRPKAANGKSLCDAFDAMGNKIKTLPRGFYLRSLFTQQLF